MKVNPEGPAAQAGLLVGDKLLSVNGVSLINCEHGKAVTALKTAGDSFPMIIMREVLSSSSSPSVEHPRMKQGEKYSTIVEQDGGQFGFSLAGGSSSTTTNETQNLYISSVNDSDASQPLAIGDRLLSINGHETSSISHEQAVEMIKTGGNQLELLLYREKLLDDTSKSNIDNTIEVSDIVINELFDREQFACRKREW
jgi:protein scribble